MRDLLALTPHVCFSLGCAALRYLRPELDTLLGAAIIVTLRSALTTVNLNPVPRDEDDVAAGTNIYFYTQVLTSYLSGNFINPVTETLKLLLAGYVYHSEADNELRLSRGLVASRRQEMG